MDSGGALPSATRLTLSQKYHLVLLLWNPHESRMTDPTLAFFDGLRAGFGGTSSVVLSRCLCDVCITGKAS